MRQTAIMDFLSEGGGPEGGWAPTSERVLNTAELGPDSLPSVPAFDQFSARRSGSSPVRTAEKAEPGPRPLTAEDLAALEAVTRSEPAPRTATGPPPPAKPPPRPEPEPPGPPVRDPDFIPTWPPEGHTAWIRADHRPPRTGRAGLGAAVLRYGRRAMGLVLVLAVASVASWYFVPRPGGPAVAATWDPSVVPTAAFVAHQERLPWKHPVRVVFLPRSAYEQRFGESLASVHSRPGPAGTGMAQFVPSGQVVYMNGSSLDIYARYALAGQLTEALRSEYPGLASAAAVQAQALRVQAMFVRQLSTTQVHALHVEQARGA